MSPPDENITVESLILDQIRDVAKTSKETMTAAIETKVLVSTQSDEIKDLKKEQRRTSRSVTNAVGEIGVLKTDTKNMGRRVGKLEKKVNCKSIPPGPRVDTRFDLLSPKVKYIIYLLGAAAAAAMGWGADKIPTP